MVTCLSCSYVRAEVEDAETALWVASEVKAASINLTKSSLENKLVCPSPIECPIHQSIANGKVRTEAMPQLAVSFWGKMEQICVALFSQMSAARVGRCNHCHILKRKITAWKDYLNVTALFRALSVIDRVIERVTTQPEREM